MLICCRFSGIDRKPPYTHPTLSDLPGATEYFESRAKDHPNTAEIYVGACHCQAIKFAVLSKPMKEARVIDCACSICLGVSDIGLSLDRDVDGSSLLTAPTLLALHILRRPHRLLLHSSCDTRPLSLVPLVFTERRPLALPRATRHLLYPLLPHHTVHPSPLPTHQIHLWS